jgi:hypothetical protein
MVVLGTMVWERSGHDKQNKTNYLSFFLSFFLSFAIDRFMYFTCYETSSVTGGQASDNQ